MTPEEVHKHIKIINGEKVFEGILNLESQNLTSLEPYNLSDVIVTRSFYCSDNNLTSLKGAPKQVKGGFWCQGNSLTSLKGASKQVNGNFYCHSNNLTSLEGLPQAIGGEIFIQKEVLQRLYFTNDLVSIYALQDKFYFVL